MSDFPISAKLFLWAVVAAAAAVGIIFGTVPTLPRDTASLFVLVFLIIANVFADIYHIHLRSRLELTISASVSFAAMIMFGPTLGAIVSASGSAASDLILRKTWYKVVFNVSNVTLSIFASGMLYGWINSEQAPALSTTESALALGAAGIVYLTVNTVIVSTMIGLIYRHGPLDFARIGYRALGFQLITLIPLGTLFTIVYYQTPWGLILLLFPIVLTYYSFDNYHKLRTESQQTIELLADAVDERDRYTYQHSVRVGTYVEKVGRSMGMDAADLETLVFAARIHDLGKIGIPSSVLLKPGKLDTDERRIIEAHPAIGARILKNLSTYDGVRELIAHHHERVDGKGYPSGLTRDEIPLGARILAVADAFEAMTADRPYRKALTIDEAMAELERGRGAQFDGDVVDHFLGVLAEERRRPQPSFEMDLRAAEREG